jgi:uncharacterized membrane protein
MKSRLRRDENGTVLLLVLGLVVIAALFVTVVIDVSALFLDRRDLVAAADGAALAGAQGVDQQSVYRAGLPDSGALTLDRSRAESLVNDYLRDQGLFDAYRDLAVDVQVTATTVTVHLSVQGRLPMANVVAAGGRGIEIDATATARSAVVS